MYLHRLHMTHTREYSYTLFISHSDFPILKIESLDMYKDNF
jgi:hypothetical protein